MDNRNIYYTIQRNSIINICDTLRNVSHSINAINFTEIPSVINTLHYSPGQARIKTGLISYFDGYYFNNNHWNANIINSVQKVNKDTFETFQQQDPNNVTLHSLPFSDPVYAYLNNTGGYNNVYLYAPYNNITFAESNFDGFQNKMKYCVFLNFNTDTLFYYAKTFRGGGLGFLENCPPHLEEAQCGMNSSFVPPSPQFFNIQTMPPTISNIAGLCSYSVYTRTVRPIECDIQNGNNITNLLSSFAGCSYYLYGNGWCGPNVIDMRNAYYSCSNLNGIGHIGPNVIYAQNAYSYCSNLVAGECGDNVISMHNTFYSCSNLKTANVGSNVEDLTNTFMYCYNLLNVDIKSTKLTNINYSFYNCNNLTDLNLNNQQFLTIYNQDCIDYCTNLQNFNLVNCSNLLNIQIPPSGLDNLHNLDASYCTNMTTATFRFDQASYNEGGRMSPELYYINLAHCNNLTSLNLINCPMTSLNFYGCNIDNREQPLLYNLTGCDKLTIGSLILNHPLLTDVDASDFKITTLDNLFTGCASVKNITVPDYVYDFPTMNNTFDGCINYENKVNFVRNMRNLTSLNGTFANCTDLTDIDFTDVHASVLYRTCYNCTNLQNVTINISNYNSVWALFEDCHNLNTDNIIIPDRNDINIEALFWNCKKYHGTGIVPNNVINARGLFAGTNINKLIIGQNAKYIPLLAYICSNLKEITTYTNDYTNIYATFRDCGIVNLSNFNINTSSNCVQTFYNSNVSSFDLYDTPNNLAYMCWGCQNLTHANMDIYGTRGTEKLNMISVFCNCQNLEGDFTFNIYNAAKDKETNMAYAFMNDKKVNSVSISGDFNFCNMRSSFCNMFALQELNILGNINKANIYMSVYADSNVKSINMGNIKSFENNSMEWAFARCTNVKNINISHVNTVQSMYCTFLNCFNLEGEMWISANANNFAYVYQGCSKMGGDIYFYSPSLNTTTAKQSNRIMGAFGNRGANPKRINIHVSPYAYINQLLYFSGQGCNYMMRNDGGTNTTYTWQTMTNCYYNTKANIYVYYNYAP